ncbi:MAG: ABC transporter permease [Planctomycetota bacterium]
MRLGDSWRLAKRALLSHRVRSSLTILGISVGVTAVLLLTALGEGAREYIRQEFDTLGSNLVAVLPGRTETAGAGMMFGNTTRDLTLEDARALEHRCTALQEVVPVVIGTVPVENGSLSINGTLIGSNRNYFKLHNLMLRSGEFLPAGFDDGKLTCVLGLEVKRKLFGNSNAVGALIEAGTWRLRVIGVTESDGVFAGLDLDELIFVPTLTAMRMFNQTSLFRIMTRSSNVESNAEARRQIREILLDRHEGDEDFSLLEPSSMQESVLDIINKLTSFLAGVATISLLVAGIGVMNIMLVTVSERHAEVGLFKALGARKNQILNVFLTESALITCLGGAVGLLIGWGGVKALALYFPSFPLSAPWWAVVGSLLLSIAVGVVFGVYPAAKAARLDPVEALSQ